MFNLIHVGNNNFINRDRILAVGRPTIACMQRAVNTAKKEGLLIDFTGNMPIMGIILMDNGTVVRIALRPKEIAVREPEDTRLVSDRVTPL